MERKLVVYQNILAKAGAVLPPDSKLAVAQTSDMIDSLTFRATEVIVQKHLSGDIHASQAVVENKLDERLKQVEGKIDDAPAAKSVAAKTALAEAKVLVKEQKYEAALSKMVEVAELSKPEPAPAPAPTTDKTEVKTDTSAGGGASTDGASAAETKPAEQPAPATTATKPADTSSTTTTDTPAAAPK